MRFELDEEGGLVGFSRASRRPEIACSSAANSVSAWPTSLNAVMADLTAISGLYGRTRPMLLMVELIREMWVAIVWVMSMLAVCPRPYLLSRDSYGA